MADQLKAGDKVQLISGSIIMTLGVYGDNICQVAYWHPDRKEIIQLKIEREMLIKVG